MKTVLNQSLFDIAPRILKTHPDFKIFLKVVDRLYEKYVAHQMKELVLLDRIDDLEEFKVDLLAEEFHVDFYPLDASLKEKKELVKQSIYTHMKKGTTAAVKNILKVFYTEAELVQWFQTTPEMEAGTFNVVVSGEAISPEDVKKVVSAIKMVQRRSQHLNKITFKNNIKNSLSPKFHRRESKKITIMPAPYYLVFNKINLNKITGERVAKYLRIGG